MCAQKGMSRPSSPHVLVIGAGPAGLEAALTAAELGAQVVLVHDAPLGGRAYGGSLVPSKVWLAEAQIGAPPEDLLARIVAVQSSARATALRELDAAGVTRIAGRGRIARPRVVTVTSGDGAERTFDVDLVVLATGSEPTFPSHLKPDGTRVIAPRHLTALQSVPRRVAVLGGGATGAEAVELFLGRGARVTWVPGRARPLREFAPAAVDGLVQSFAERGVEILPGTRAATLARPEGAPLVLTTENGGQVEADLVFVAVGRVADRTGQGLEAAGLPTDAALNVAPSGAVTPWLYLVGDVAGEPFLANRAAAQARLAVRHALGVACEREVTRALLPVVRAVYTRPELAQVGELEGPDLIVHEAPFDLVLRAHLDRPAGRFALAADQEGRVRGAWAVGRHASETLAPVAAALALDGTVAGLAATWPASPTLGELAPVVARRMLARGAGRVAEVPREEPNAAHPC
jgi:pyruvate/2-oxoglutarate dehydrogenase complex dihydrolipoamide dehydrogenase (E3) component